jgi:phospholipase/carboxylesterase
LNSQAGNRLVGGQTLAGQPDVILETGKSPRWAVIWLHGLGADGHDFEPIVPELIGPDWPALRFIFPHAETRPVTINGGMRMRAWYDIKSLDRSALGEADGMRASIARIHAMIADLEHAGIASSQVFLIGFSQGGAMAYAAGLRYPQRLAGIAALSAYLPLQSSLDSEASKANMQTPIFAAHGLQDPVVPLALGLGSAELLKAKAWPIGWHTYHMAHSVCAEEIQDLHVWMHRRIVSAADS